MRFSESRYLIDFDAARSSRRTKVLVRASPPVSHPRRSPHVEDLAITLPATIKFFNRLLMFISLFDLFRVFRGNIFL